MTDRDEFMRAAISAHGQRSIAATASANPEDAGKAVAGQPAGQAVCRDDGRCQYAIDHGAEGLGHCPEGKCCMPLSPVAQMSGEQERAIEDAHCVAAADIYFGARTHLMDTTANRNIFDAGFKAAYRLASHPSNAVQDAPTLTTERIDWIANSHCATGVAYPIHVKQAINQALRESAATVPQVVQAPEGWKLVPINPTSEMLEAGNDSGEDWWGNDCRGVEHKMPDVWSAMLNAAPQPVAASPSIVPSDELDTVLNVLDMYADEIPPLLDIIDDRAGGSSGATEKLHELSGAIKYVTNKGRALLTTASNAVNADSERLDWMEDWVALQFPDGATGNNIRELVDSGRKIIDAQIASNAGEVKS